MQKGMIRLCMLGCVFWTLLSPAAAYCGTTTGQQSCQVVQAPLRKLSCNVGKHGGVQYQPLIQDHRFQGSDFKESCLVNAGVTCANPENAGQPVTTTDSCCSCFLYARYCHGQSGKFVTNHSPSGSDHTLVMPTSACTGIENWDNFGCPGESIWDEAHSQLTSAGRDALWGMSINPVGRRGQHQMHVHLAQVDSTLMNAIVTGVQAKKSKFYVDCSLSGSKHRLDGCSYSTTQCTNCPEVHIKSNTNKPSAAGPFSTAYGPKPSNSNPNALQASTLVLRLPNKVATDTWAVVINSNGPAECFFAKKAGSDLLTACPQ